MWASILPIVIKWAKNPLVIISVIAFIVISGLFVKIKFMEAKLDRMEGQLIVAEANLERMENNFNTCKTNEQTLRDVIDEQNGSLTSMETITTALQEQLRKEQENASKWEDRYKKRPVITEVKEVPVVQYIEKELVIDEDASKEYINYFNSLLD